jgi:iron complex transport system substrate-binding protein
MNPPNRPISRLVSLLPAASEILALLGLSHLLVGRSHECDYPASLAHIPVLTRPRPLGFSPAAIDHAVKDAAADARALFDLDADALAALRPDLIITQDLCHVCSVDLAQVRRVAASLAPAPELLSLNPTTLEAVLDDVLRIGRAAGVADAAARAVVGLRASTSTLSTRALRSRSSNGPNPCTSAGTGSRR